MNHKSKRTISEKPKNDFRELRELFIRLHLPCKVGDDVYKLWYTECHLGETHPDSYACCGCEDECDMKRAIVKIKVPSIEFIVRELMKPNNSVYYLTRKEAEKALKEKK